MNCIVAGIVGLKLVKQKEQWALLHEGAITKDDLDGFSDELRLSLLGA